MSILGPEFYVRDTVEVAQSLLGKYLVRSWQGALLAGRIVETEAYIGRCDKACHAYQYHRTKRTETLFSSPGHAYIYLIYGLYHCLNFVTEPEGEPAAVLIRGLEPMAGVEEMARLRYGEKPLTPARLKRMLDGPGKLCQGLALTREENGIPLFAPPLLVCDDLGDAGLPAPSPPPPRQIASGPRVGIDYAQEARDFPWRFRLLPL